MSVDKRVIYNLGLLHHYEEYGIEIPLLDQRVLKTISNLKENFNLHESFFCPVTIKDLSLAHSDKFLNRLEQDPNGVVLDTYELINQDGSYNRYKPSSATKPLSDFIDKAKGHVYGTYLAAVRALDLGFAYHLGGGMHHAMSMRPGGFCMFNDLIITARKLQKEFYVNKVLIIDLDCHKGDGTAEISYGDDSIFTFSIHMQDGWPLNSNKYDRDGNLNPSFITSDCDVSVENSKNYLSQLKLALEVIDITNFDIALVVHGVDVYAGDTLESSKGIRLSKEEILERDLYVYDYLKNENLSQAWCQGGGYGDKIHELYIQFLERVL
jgi:acetoin utilization deacetylase AcuC-like enzyme